MALARLSDGLAIDNQEGTMTNIQNETSGGEERASNNQETPHGNPEETLDEAENSFDRPKDCLGKPGASQDKPEGNPDDQNCKKSPGNLWLSIDHQNESLSIDTLG